MKQFEPGRRGHIDGTFMGPSDHAYLTAGPVAQESKIMAHVRIVIDRARPFSLGFSKQLRMGTFDFNATLMGSRIARVIPIGSNRAFWTVLYHG